jgi:hypothetical protein
MGDRGADGTGKRELRMGFTGGIVSMLVNVDPEIEDNGDSWPGGKGRHGKCTFCSNCSRVICSN